MMITRLNITDENDNRFIDEIERAFFQAIDITVEYSNRPSKALGIAYPTYARIYVAHAVLNTPDIQLNVNRRHATIAHELGHMYQKSTDRNMVNEIEQERYADTFAAMCLGNRWSITYATAITNYKSFHLYRKAAPGFTGDTVNYKGFELSVTDWGRTASGSIRNLKTNTTFYYYRLNADNMRKQLTAVVDYLVSCL